MKTKLNLIDLITCSADEALPANHFVSLSNSSMNHTPDDPEASGLAKTR